MSLHIMAFVDYIEAYRAYYRGQAGELPGAISKAYKLAIDAQLLGQDDADKDLQAFSHALMGERCDDALRAFRRQPTPKNRGAMLLTMQEAQEMGATDGPGCRGVVREVTKLYDSGVLP